MPAPLGRLLAEEREMPFVDLDAAGRRRGAQSSVADIFAEQGEEQFRRSSPKRSRASPARALSRGVRGRGRTQPREPRVAQGTRRGRAPAGLSGRGGGAHRQLTDAAAPERPGRHARRHLASAGAPLPVLLGGRRRRGHRWPDRPRGLGRGHQGSRGAGCADDDRGPGGRGWRILRGGDRPRRASTPRPRVRSLTDVSRCAVITDATVARLHAMHALTSLARAEFQPFDVQIPAGESSKSWTNAGSLLEAFATSGLGRHDPVVAVGGGVVGDLAGFVAGSTCAGSRSSRCRPLCSRWSTPRSAARPRST